MSAIERTGSRRQGRASIIAVFTSSAFRPSSRRTIGSGHRRHFAAAAFGSARLEFLGAEFPAGRTVSAFRLAPPERAIEFGASAQRRPETFHRLGRAALDGAFVVFADHVATIAHDLQPRNPVVDRRLGQTHAKLDQHALSDRRGSQARKAEDGEPLVLVLVTAKHPLDVDREPHERIRLGNNRQSAKPRTEQPRDDRADVEGWLPRQSGRPAFDDWTYRKPLPVSHAKPEPAAFAMDARGGPTEGRGDRRRRDIIEPERDQETHIPDRPRLRRGWPAKRLFRRLPKPQRRGPLADFLFVKPQIKRERRNPMAGARHSRQQDIDRGRLLGGAHEARRPFRRNWA